MLTMGSYKEKRAAGELVRDGDVIMEPSNQGDVIAD